MDTTEYTMGQAFQSLGYSTFVVGKWNLGDLDRCYPTPLDKQKLRNITLIWFFSNNGGIGLTASSVPLNWKKEIKFEGGQRVPFVMNWPDHVQAGKTFGGLTSAMDIFATSFKLAGGKTALRPLDGVDLMPYVSSQKSGAPHQRLFWRKQEGPALRVGD